jgi:hypothetical protein
MQKSPAVPNIARGGDLVIVSGVSSVVKGAGRMSCAERRSLVGYVVGEVPSGSVTEACLRQ